MDATLKPMTAPAFAKLLTELCEEHGRLWVVRQAHDDGTVLVVSSRTSEPVHILLADTKRKRG